MGMRPAKGLQQERTVLRVNFFGMGAIVRNIGPWAVLLALPLIDSCRVEPGNYYFSQLRIDDRLHLLPEGTRSITAPNPKNDMYYFLFRGAYVTSVDHFLKRAGGGEPERLFYLEANPDQLLDRTVKYVVLLEGSFGTVYATKTCFYNRPVAENFDTVAVGSNQKNLGALPSEIPDPRTELPPLTGFSLVRIFRTGAEHLVIGANYELNGDLGSLHISGTKDGEWSSTNAGGNFLALGGWGGRLERYGIPAHIDIQQYLKRRRLPLPLVAMAQELNVVHQHFDYGKVIRQDKLRDGMIVSSRFLQPVVTEEEQALGPACDSRLHQQWSMGLRTVD